MRAFVFTDSALVGQAGRFVWLEIDTEKAHNAVVRKRLNIPALPSFFVLDPADGRVALRWTGGATVAQLTKILDDGAEAVFPGSGPSLEVAYGAKSGIVGWELSPQGMSTAHSIARADSAYAAADYAVAATAYRQALATAPPGWPPYARVVESLLFSLQSIDSCEAVTRVAAEAWPRLARSSSSANLAASGLACALELPKDHPQRAATIATFEKACRAVVADTTLPIAADDYSAVYGTLVDLADDRKDEAASKRAAEDWAHYLDGEAARAKTPDQRVVFDSHRLAAYLAAGTPERAIPMLEASEKDFPGDYNPPARLAITYRAMKRWDDGLAASDRALAKAYGPRRLSLLQTRADLYAGKGDDASRRRTLEQALAEAEAFPPGQRSEAAIASLKKKLEATP